MGRYAKETGGKTFTEVEPGAHVARYFRLIDLGTQHGEYLGEPKIQNTIVIQWELPFETIQTEEKEPMIISRFYTNSLSEKAHLRKDLETVRTRPFTEAELAGFDLNAILGKPCVVQVVRTDKGKSKVVSVGAMTKGTTCPPLVNTPSAFWLDEWDDDAFQALPEGFRKIIMESDEYKAIRAPAVAAQTLSRGPHVDPLDDDIPFRSVEHGDLKNMPQDNERFDALQKRIDALANKLRPSHG